MDHPRLSEVDRFEMALWKVIDPLIESRKLTFMDVVMVLAKIIGHLSSAENK